MTEPAALNVVDKARRFLSAFDDLCAAFVKARAAAEYLREALEADGVEHRARPHHRICMNCSRPFDAHRSSASYCSDVCRQAARKARA